MSDSATPTEKSPIRPDALGVDAPSTLEALAAKLAALHAYSTRYGITRPAADLLGEILDDVRRVQATAEAEWISPGQASDISGYTTERLRQMSANGRLRRNGSRFLRGEIQRLRTQRGRTATTAAATSVESPPLPAPNAQEEEGPPPAPKREPQVESHDRVDALNAHGETGVRNPLTGRALGIHPDRLRQ
ncbi:hypothetical protein [Gemmatimonas sp.]|uniref:hypothetical protein n=1 Tax=Gemmatimonas sp. TaxID=1962908 RepID=UPI003F6F99D3